MDDDYGKKLDSLGSYFNSQQVAHVGYLLVIAAFVLQLLMLFFTKDSPLYSSWPLLSIAVVLFLLLFFSFWYSLARTQLYSVYSQILWELRGITGSSTKEIVSSSVDLDQASLTELIQFIMYVRLFASREKNWGEYLVAIGHETSTHIHPRKLDSLKTELRRGDLSNRKLFRIIPLWFLIPIALLFMERYIGPKSLTAGPFFHVTGYNLLLNKKQLKRWNPVKGRWEPQRTPTVTSTKA